MEHLLKFLIADDIVGGDYGTNEHGWRDSWFCWFRDNEVAWCLSIDDMGTGSEEIHEPFNLFWVEGSHKRERE